MSTPSRPPGKRALIAAVVGLVVALPVNVVTETPLGWPIGLIAAGLVWLLTAPVALQPKETGDAIWDAAGRKARRRGQR